MTDPSGRTSTPEDRARFRRNLVRVLTIQIATLVALWLLQSRYTG